MYSRGEGAWSSSLEMFASRFSEASEIPREVHSSLFWLVLIDSAPDPIGQKTDDVPVEVLNVVLHHTGVEGVFEHPGLAVPGRPVTANGVSTNGENASGTRESRRRYQIRMKQKVLVCDEN